MESRGSGKIPSSKPLFRDNSTTNYSNNKPMHYSEMQSSNAVYSPVNNFSLEKHLGPGFGRGSNFYSTEFKIMEKSEMQSSNAVYSPVNNFSLEKHIGPGFGRGSNFYSTEFKIMEKRDIFSLLFELPEEEIDAFVAMYISQRYRNLSKETDNKHLDMVFKLGQCVYCSRTSLFVCSTCKVWYCSNFCLFLDSRAHQKTCIPKIIVGLNQDFTFNVVVDNEQFSNAEETVNEQTVNVTRSQDDNGNGSNRRGGETPRGNQRKNNQEESDQSGDNSRESVNLKVCRHKPGRESSTTARQTSGRTANPFQPQPPIPYNQFTETSGRTANPFQPQPPIPYNQFTEVTVTALCKEKYGFWAYRNSVFNEQADIMRELKNISKTAFPLRAKLKSGFKVCAPFGGNWYRAEVKHINGNKVTIFFIDFGNEDSVNIRDIFPLTRKLISKPALAHQFLLANSSGNPVIAEDIILKLKPIRLVGDTWLAHVEGVKYEE